MFMIDTPVLVGICLMIALGLLGVVALLSSNERKEAKSAKK